MRLITFILILLTFSFCKKKAVTKDQETQPPICCELPYFNRVVDSYFIAGSLKSNLSVDNAGSFINLMISPKSVFSSTVKADSFLYYKHLYQDSGYYGNYSYGEILADTISNISILTLYDLDIKHKRNDTINNITNIEYTTVYDFIQSRFNPSISNFPKTDLKEFNSKERLMVKAEYIHLTVPYIKPISGKWQYEIRIKFKSGKVVRDTTNLI